MNKSEIELPKNKSPLWSASFQGLLLTNWLTAINDNIFRWFVIGVGKSMFPVSDHSGILMWGTALFVAPYIFLASPAGWLADRFRKRYVIVGCKFAEVLIMALGVLAVWLGSFRMLLFTVFLMGAQSALFAPAKIGTIPELLDEETISTGNGIFNLATLSATVIGMAMGSALADVTLGGSTNLYIAAITMIGIAVVGTFISFAIQTLPAADKNAKFPKTIILETIRDIVSLIGMGKLFRVALGVMFFWTIAGMAQLNVDAFADEAGALLESEKTPLLVCLTLGVGLGSVLAGFVSAGRIELGLVPWGALGIAIFSILLLFTPAYFLVGAAFNTKLIVACLLLAGLGMSAGFFDVPLASYLQKKSPIEKRGAILSATNCLGFGGIAVASVLFGTVLRQDTNPGDISQLPAAYIGSTMSADEKANVDSLTNQFAPQLASLKFDKESEQPLERLVLPKNLSEPSRTALVTNLIHKDITSDESNIDTPEKYEQLFPDDLKQVKVVTRASAKQPWYSAKQIFLLLGLMAIPVFAYAAWRLPQKMARVAFWWLLKVLYKNKVRGLENIPEKGGAILVFNHCSWLDGVTILSLIPHKLRTIAWGGNFTNFFARKWAEFCDVILITGGPKSIRRGLANANQALEDGELVGIFAEGGITRSGMIRSVKPGVMKMLESSNVPVIPCYIGEMWGSIFSYFGGRVFTKYPNSIRRPLSLHIGKPFHPKSSFEIQDALKRLSAESVDHYVGKFEPAIVKTINQCKRRRFKTKIADSSQQTETGGKLLTRAIVLRRLLRRVVLDNDERNVAVLIPPSNGGLIVNVALELDRRIAVNLNYSLSEDVMNFCIKEAGIKTVLTSRKVMEKLDFNLDAKVFFLDDLKDEVNGTDKAIGAIQSFVTPTWLLKRMYGLHKIKPDDMMTIIFTSGSTGTPKGVMLSQLNIATNINAIEQAASFNKDDVMVGVLPFFHSFGFTATLWAVMACDIGGAYHFSPLDAKQIGKLVHRAKGTILVATPTFLRSYMRRCTVEQFETLDMVVAGAERLPPELAESFNEKFGVVPVEGYGATELSPIASVNIPHSRQFGKKFQIDDKAGTVGRAIKSVATKVTDLDTGEEVGKDVSGMLWIKGPNVMMGYLNRQDLTDDVIVDGWYKTGDVALLDKDGFIKITGRMSRFSKIGGEMVPHIKIEEILSKLCDFTPEDDTDDDKPNVAVTAVPDVKKGERLIVLHTKIPKTPAELREGLSEAGLPNIFIPSEDSFRKVDQLPMLGSGKLDLKGIKVMAEELFGQGKE